MSKFGIFTAVLTGRLKQIKFLLKRGQSLNVKNVDHQNLLMVALQIADEAQRYKVFNFLVTKGADMSTIDNCGRHILSWACALNCQDEVDLILQEIGGEVDYSKLDNFGYAALHYAVLNDNPRIAHALVRSMTKYYLSVDLKNGDGFSPYTLAKRLGHTQCASILVQYGASHCQFDEKSFKGADDWEVIGFWERCQAVEVQENKALAFLRSMGRLPQLRAANFNLSKVNLVETPLERTGLTRLEIKNKIKLPIIHRRRRQSDSNLVTRVTTPESMSSITLSDTDEPMPRNQEPKSIETAMSLLNLQSGLIGDTVNIKPKFEKEVLIIPDKQTKVKFSFQEIRSK